MKFAIYLFTICLLFTTACCKKNVTAKNNIEQDKIEKSEAEAQAAAKQKEYDEAEKQAVLIEQMKNEKLPNEGENYYKIAEKEIPENAVARIQKTACFGRCPIYTMIIFDDGRVEYYGKKFVDKIGPHYAKAPIQMIEELMAKAKEIGFFDLNDVYDKEAVTDVPSTITTIMGEEGFKTVVNRFDAPESIRKFEMYIEETFNALEYSSPD